MGVTKGFRFINIRNLSISTWPTFSKSPQRPISCRGSRPLGISNSPRNSREKSLCLSISVVVMPARAIRNAKTAPAGPAPAIITLGDVMFVIEPLSLVIARLGVFQRVKEKLLSLGLRVGTRSTSRLTSISAGPATRFPKFLPCLKV